MCVVPIPALTEKDRADLHFALEQKADWIALSFVQRPEDVAEARELIGEKAALLAKIEKPAAIDRLDDIVALADAVMVARGDLGVELPPEQVPPLQNRIVACARQFGKPVVVATQMLESMIISPTPTRAEVSDVATAIYDGADAVMLSAESAAGQYPVRGGGDDGPHRHQRRARPDLSRRGSISPRPGSSRPPPMHWPVRRGRSPAPSRRRAMVCYTSSGSTARRIARERPSVPILAMSASLHTARRMGLTWGVYAVHSRDVSSFEEMVEKAKRMALRHRSRRAATGSSHGRNPFRDRGLDQRAPRRPADRRRARKTYADQGLDRVRLPPIDLEPAAPKERRQGERALATTIEELEQRREAARMGGGREAHRCPACQGPADRARAAFRAARSRQLRRI